MKILHLIDSLGYNGSARQLHLLGRARAQGPDSIEICCLGPETPWSESLRQAGVRMHALGWTRWFDFGVLWKLRELLRATSFDLIHVWRLPALRALAVVAKQLLPRVVMSAPLSVNRKLAWWDRRLLQQVRCVAVAGVSDQESCRQQGIVGAAVRVVAPAATCDQSVMAPITDKESPSILCIGNLERATGFRQAIWAFDFVRNFFPAARLQIVGAGSQLPLLRNLTAGLQCAALVEFLGTPADVAQVLRGAEVVWIPSQANTGRQVALDAMAQGRAVIASDVPSLREVMRDGETGYLAAVGDIVQFVRRTKSLLEDERLRQRINEAACRHVERQFSVPEAIERWRDLYRAVV